MRSIVMRDKTLHTFGEDLPSIEVIAFALSHINRFTGHVGAYSVAQHCVHASHLIGPEALRLSALLHDAPEAIYGDLSSPLKAYLNDPAFIEMELDYHEKIDAKYHVATRHPAVKVCDVRLLLTEAVSFELPLGCFPDVEPYAYDIVPWSAKVAERAFLDQFVKLGGRE